MVSLLTGASLVIGYALLGACWLVWKTEGELQDKARGYARWLAPALLVAIGLVSLGTLTLEAQYYTRWLAWPGLLVAVPMPLATLGVTLMLLRALKGSRDLAPFLWALALFGLTLMGLAVSIWPDVVPARITIWQAAAPDRSLAFMLVGAGVLVPVILAYTGWAYWVFRGKVGHEGYH